MLCDLLAPATLVALSLYVHPAHPFVHYLDLQLSVGTLRVISVHGVRNPRDRGSGNHSSLLKFQC